uniref:Putative secreted protein n=1 Tax=Ixodes ricinus TaxID=34613 RepID=A0A6B0UM07_IXORI
MRADADWIFFLPLALLRSRVFCFGDVPVSPKSQSSTPSAVFFFPVCRIRIVSCSAETPAWFSFFVCFVFERTRGERRWEFGQTTITVLPRECWRAAPCRGGWKCTIFNNRVHFLFFFI